MNSEAYIAFRQNGNTDFYPRNIDPDTVSSLCAEVTRNDPKYRSECLVIRRSGDMIYYAFVRAVPGRPNSYTGILIGLNSVVVSNLPDLYGFFTQEMETLTAVCHLTRYSSATDIGSYRDINRAYKLLREDFNSRYKNISSAPGPLDYTRRPVIDRLHIKTDGNIVRLTTGGDNARGLNVRKTIESGDTLVVTSEHAEIQNRTKADEPRPATTRTTAKPANPKKKKWLVPALIAAVIIVLWVGYSNFHKTSISVPDITDTYTTNPERQILESTGYSQGNSTIHYYKGHFTHQGTDYPVMIAFIETDGQISKVIYKNVEYGGRIPMSYWSDGQRVRLSGKDGPNDFNIDLKTDAMYLTGVTTDGDKTMDVKLAPTLETFEIRGT